MSASTPATSAATISEATRRTLCDWFGSANVLWWGRLQEDDFLARLYPIDQMPSFDPRHKTAFADIHQHRIRWADWENDWVFTDRRFNLLRGSDENFLRFLCETVHPAVRPDAEDVMRMVQFFNGELRADGWELGEGRRMSDRPVYVANKVGTRSVIFEEPTGWHKADRQLARARDLLKAAKAEEDFQTVGVVCREALISAAQAVYDPVRHPIMDGVAVSATDAGRMIEAYVAVELAGSVNEEARAHAKAALKLANAVQHKRTGTFKTAALCAEATASILNILAVLSDKRMTPAEARFSDADMSEGLTLDEMPF